MTFWVGLCREDRNQGMKERVEKLRKLLGDNGIKIFHILLLTSGQAKRQFMLV